MDSRKRKLPQAGLLGRRVRARAEPEPDFDNFEDDASSDASSGAPGEQDGEDNESASASGGSDDSEAPDESDASSDESDQEDISADASKVSFGALAKAQAMLPLAGRRKKKAEPAEEAEAGAEEARSNESRAVSTTRREKPPSRTSKHAPTETSAKFPVSRKREILQVHKIVARDPRFDPLITSRSSAAAHHGGNSKVDEDHARRAYAFLDEYRDDEIRQLKAAIKKVKTPVEKENLQRALMSMESRKKTQDKRAKERALIDEHRKRERELVKEGKKANPFYLKKSEQKKQLLVDQFTGLSEKQREHAIERKRKKVTSKEKKTLPMERRMRD